MKAKIFNFSGHIKKKVKSTFWAFKYQKKDVEKDKKINVLYILIGMWKF